MELGNTTNVSSGIAGMNQKSYCPFDNDSTAEKNVKSGLRVWKMPDGEDLQASIRKGDWCKVAMAILIKRHTSVSNIWIAGRLGMGHGQAVSRLIKQGKAGATIQKQCRELGKMLQCEDPRDD